MADRKITTYGKLVLVTYGFFLLLGLSWFLMSLASGNPNYIAFIITAVFAAQFYYRHRITNLVLGILGLFFSIVMFLEAVTLHDPNAKEFVYDTPTKILICICVVSIVSSGILIFSYTKLSFADE